MIVPPTIPTTAPGAAAAPPLLRVSGELSAPIGSLLAAVVTSVTPQAATIDVGGQAVSVRPPAGLSPGATLLLKVPAAGTLEVVGQTPSNVRAVVGEIPSLPADVPTQGTVVRATPQQATIDVNGDTLVVRPGAGLAPGTVVTVRVPPAATGVEVTPAAATAVRSTVGRPPVTGLIAATVNRAAPQEATLDVNGQTLTVRPGDGLNPGTVVVARVRPDGAVEVLGTTPGKVSAPPTAPAAQTVQPPPAAPEAAAPRLPTVTVEAVAVRPDGRFAVRIDGREVVAESDVPLAPGGTYTVQVDGPDDAPVLRRPPGPTPPAAPPRAATVDVIAVRPDGRFVVRIDGEPAFATSPTPLAPGGRYVMQVDGPPSAAVLRPLPDATPANVATAVLRANPAPPPLGELIAPLLAEVAKHDANPATAELKQALEAIVKPDGKPPTAGELKAMTDDGGLMYEAKLARRAAGGDPPAADLKGGLLRLVRALPDLADAAPAARATLDAIETRQAANVASRAESGPYFLQLPVPDGGRWRTLHLAVEPGTDEPTPDRPTGDGGFRVLMHIELDGLGPVWIDAGMSAGRLSAALYLDAAEAREAVRRELPGLRGEREADGVGAVLLDVRSTAELPAARRPQAAALLAGRPPVGLVDARA